VASGRRADLGRQAEPGLQAALALRAEPGLQAAAGVRAKQQLMAESMHFVLTTAGPRSSPIDSSRLHLDESVELTGPGVAPIFTPESRMLSGLRWQNGRLLVLADKGFWDIGLDNSARWYDASSVLLHGALPGDVDGDGDQDLLLLGTYLPEVTSSGIPSGPATRLSVWERTPAGLAERGDVLKSSGFILAMPFAFGDVDGDADLDIVAFERGAPVGYVNGGSFTFTRTLLGETKPEYENKLVLVADLADRNGDDAQDLLVVAGEALEFDAFVLLGDGAGKFAAPGPAVQDRTPLVPYGPAGFGIAVADVTGDGLADIVTQDSRDSIMPHLRLIASVDAKTLAPPVQVEPGCLGFEFADVDEDGTLDIVTTIENRLFALISRGNGAFEQRDLGIGVAMPEVMDFTTDPGEGSAPARVHILYNPACRACDATCSGRCVWKTCVACLADDDCMTGRCEKQACVP
jgi:hypothetical protein